MPRLLAVVFGRLASLVLAEPRAGCLEVKKTARFTVYFEHVELEKLLQTVSDATCVSFLVSDGVKGRISIVGPENGKLQLDADAFYAAFLSALDANGFAAVPQGRFVRIVEKRTARQFPVPLLGGTDELPLGESILTRLYRLTFTDLDTARAGVQAVSSVGGEVIPVAPDLLIVTDLSSNHRRIERVLGELDVPRPPTDVLRFVRLRFASAVEVMEVLGRALAQKSGSRPQDGLVSIVDERSNRILLAGAPHSVERAERLIGELDV